jgi:signal transduction histidine kinase
MSKPAIICVDDEPGLENLKIDLARVLGDSCLIKTAKSGKAALEVLKELQIDQCDVAVVFVAQMLLKAEGDALLEHIHLLSPQTLNIVMGGQADRKTPNPGIYSARYRHLVQPWKAEELESTVLEAIQSYYQFRNLELQNVKLQATVQSLEQTIVQLTQSQAQFWQQTHQQEALSRVFLAFAMQQAQIYQAAQMQVKELEHLNQLKDDFLHAVSHELRAPISNIRMATQMLEVRLQQLEDDDTRSQCARYFQILRAECQRETDLINDLLALIRLDSSDPLNISAINLSLWLPHIAEPFMERMQEKEQQLQLDLPLVLPTLTTDPSHLERILTELLTNAWRYTPVGETVTLTARVVQPLPSAVESTEQERYPKSDQRVGTTTVPAVALVRLPSELWISVSNSGVEIPSEEHERIFDQFYRIPNSQGFHQGGTGLGLAIVKKRLGKLQGTVSVVSQQNQTTFTIKLPLHLSINQL